MNNYHYTHTFVHTGYCIQVFSLANKRASVIATSKLLDSLHSHIETNSIQIYWDELLYTKSVRGRVRNSCTCMHACAT